MDKTSAFSSSLQGVRGVQKSLQRPDVRALPQRSGHPHPLRQKQVHLPGDRAPVQLGERGELTARSAVRSVAGCPAPAGDCVNDLTVEPRPLLRVGPARTVTMSMRGLMRGPMCFLTNGMYV